MPYKPTGRPVGRPKTKDYKTISLKIPQDLLNRVQRYASVHRQSVSELIRDGLEWRITEGDPRGLHGHSKLYSGNTELEELAQPTHLVDADVPFDEDLAAVPAPRPHDGNTILPEGVRSQPATPPAQPQNGNTVPAYDTTKYTLGTLCPRGHDYHGTGQSLLRLANHGCISCDREKARERRQAKQSPATAALQQKSMLLAQIRRWQQKEALGPQAIAERLNANQVPTLSSRGQWSRGTVAKLLQSNQPVPARRTTRTPTRT